MMTTHASRNVQSSVPGNIVSLLSNNVNAGMHHHASGRLNPFATKENAKVYVD